jgi:integrase
MRFILMTLGRLDEVCSMTWRQVDMEAGTWELSDTKNTFDHRVPLSRQTIDLLRTMQPAQPHPDAFVFHHSTGGRLCNWDREQKRINARSGTSGWHRHDLRRTGATTLGDMQVLPDIVEAALNHKDIHSVLAATYNRSRYRPLVADALQRLADALDNIEFGGAQIVPLRHG